MVKIFTIFLLFISLDLFAQFVEGQILIYGTNKPLANATIYYEGIYKGGISDKHGIFTGIYLGSRMHYIRSLYNDQLRQEGDTLLNLAGKSRDYNGLVVDQENGRTLPAYLKKE